VAVVEHQPQPVVVEVAASCGETLGVLDFHVEVVLVMLVGTCGNDRSTGSAPPSTPQLTNGQALQGDCEANRSLDSSSSPRDGDRKPYKRLVRLSSSCTRVSTTSGGVARGVALYQS
jgi:hypothetical protein